MTTNLKLADPIVQLPTDNTKLNQQEIEIVNSIFQKHGTQIDTIVTELKDSIIAGLLFIVLSLPQVDKIIISFFPSLNESPIILTVVKAVIFIILFYFIKNYALS